MSIMTEETIYKESSPMGQKNAYRLFVVVFSSTSYLKLKV